MNKVNKNIKAIIKEVIMTEIYQINSFNELYNLIDMKREQMDKSKAKKLLSSLALTLSEFDEKNSLLDR